MCITVVHRGGTCKNSHVDLGLRLCNAKSFDHTSLVWDYLLRKSIRLHSWIRYIAIGAQCHSIIQTRTRRVVAKRIVPLRYWWVKTRNCRIVRKLPWPSISVLSVFRFITSVTKLHSEVASRNCRPKRSYVMSGRKIIGELLRTVLLGFQFYYWLLFDLGILYCAYVWSKPINFFLFA